MNWFLFWLFLHILAAIVGFGPVFVFPLLGNHAASHPRAASTVVHLSHTLESVYVQRIGGTMLISGIGLIWSADINFFATWYLTVAVVLYFAAFGIAGSLLAPATKRMIAIVDGHPDGLEGDAAAAAEMQALAARQRTVGILVTVLFLAIVFLMIVQPGGIVPR